MGVGRRLRADREVGKEVAEDARQETVAAQPGAIMVVRRDEAEFRNGQDIE